MYTQQQLREENEAFAGTGGVSCNNCHARFVPAFRDSTTGRVELARTDDGRPASMHLFCCLPEEWIAARGEDGSVKALVDSVVAGFVRDGIFFTREEAARLV
jgi:hypothetical protein